MEKYEVEYGKTTVRYTQEKLERFAREYGIHDFEDDHDYLVAAVKHFCATHFMYGNAADLKSYDAETRGCRTHEWEYHPNGHFKGWIYARVVEE